MTTRGLGPTWPVLPPPDLADAYAELPQTWKTGAVLLANRLLAAAYRADVLEVVEQITRDVEAGAVRGMTVTDYLEECCEGHRRVVDTNLALQCLQYSPAAYRPPISINRWGLLQAAQDCFRRDVEQELDRRGILGEDGPDAIELAESPF